MYITTILSEYPVCCAFASVLPPPWASICIQQDKQLLGRKNLLHSISNHAPEPIIFCMHVLDRYLDLTWGVDDYLSDGFGSVFHLERHVKRPTVDILLAVRALAYVMLFRCQSRATSSTYCFRLVHRAAHHVPLLRERRYSVASSSWSPTIWIPCSGNDFNISFDRQRPCVPSTDTLRTLSVAMVTPLCPIFLLSLSRASGFVLHALLHPSLRPPPFLSCRTLFPCSGIFCLSLLLLAIVHFLFAGRPDPSTRVPIFSPPSGYVVIPASTLLHQSAPRFPR